MSQDGILGELLKRSMLSGIPLKPAIINNELVIEFTEQEFFEATTKDLDPRIRQYLSIKFENGKMIIRVRLF